MKRIKLVAAAISLCMAVSLFAGCNNTTDESAEVSRIGGGQTKISVDASGSDNQNANVFNFRYKGYDMAPGNEIGPYLDVLGEPLEDPKPSRGCGGEGLFTTYKQSDFYIQTYIEEGTDRELIYSIVITGSLIDFGGVHVGDTIDAAKQVYGTPTVDEEGGITYISGNIILFFASDGMNAIAEIQYRDDSVI